MKRILPKYLYHKSPIDNRFSIMRDGLQPKVGESYLCHWNYKEGLKPLIFLYDKSVCEYDTTYDDDVYRIDTVKLDKRMISRDPDKGMAGCYTYCMQIPNTCCDIIHEGTGRDLLI